MSYDDYIEVSEYDMKNDTSDVFAVLMGRFQPFHKEHYGVIERISKRYQNIILLIGEQKGTDQLTYQERASIINDSIKGLFNKVAIIPMYDFGTDEEWGVDVIERCLEVCGSAVNMVIIKPRKNGDLDGEGNHYLDMFDVTGRTENIPVGDHDIHGTDIRANPLDCLDLVCPNFRPLVEYNIGKPYPEEFVRGSRYGTDEDWVTLKTFNRIERVPYVYAHRKNKDSIAFIFYNTKTDKYGILIEQKPPIGSMKTFSAFGGSFDNPLDNPYRILRQECWEEAGIKEFWPVYKGSYMATTQSDEIMHLYLVETKEEKFEPHTDDVGEIGNICVWMTRDEIESIPDWRVQICLRK